MIQPIVIIFLLLAIAFAAVHAFAILASLYWYYWWFDIVMHFWGGCLIALGLHALSTFSRFTFKPNMKLLVVALAVITLVWESFEFFVGLWQPETYLFDTLKDIAVGFSGGLVCYFTLKRYTMK